MFISNLAKHIPETHKYYSLLQNTLDNIHKIANEVNEKVREEENKLKLCEIVKQLKIEVIKYILGYYNFW